jgi:hypothetical protein
LARAFSVQLPSDRESKSALVPCTELMRRKPPSSSSSSALVKMHSVENHVILGQEPGAREGQVGHVHHSRRNHQAVDHQPLELGDISLQNTGHEGYTCWRMGARPAALHPCPRACLVEPELVVHEGVGREVHVHAGPAFVLDGQVLHAAEAVDLVHSLEHVIDGGLLVQEARRHTVEHGNGAGVNLHHDASIHLSSPAFQKRTGWRGILVCPPACESRTR